MDTVTFEFDKNNPDIEKIFQQLPMEFVKAPIQSTFRTAVKPFIDEAQKNVPEKMKSISSAIGVKNNKTASILAGVRLKRMYVMLRDGRNYDAYYPLYWKNYGTLDKRDPLHKFDKARRRKSVNWKGGINAGRFMETSWETTKDKVGQLISKTLAKRVVKFLEKRAVQ